LYTACLNLIINKYVGSSTFAIFITNNVYISQERHLQRHRVKPVSLRFCIKLTDLAQLIT